MRTLAILQFAVIVAATAGALAFTAITCYAAPPVGVTLSAAVSLALLRFSRLRVRTPAPAPR